MVELGETLLQLMSGHRESVRLFARAERERERGFTPAALDAYQDYVECGRTYLAALAAFKAEHPESPLEVPGEAQRLINGLFVTADIADALAQQVLAMSLRSEATAVSTTYLDRIGQAETQRSQAASLTLQGRFNEAIVALLVVRDVMTAHDDIDGLVRVTLDLADIYQWLGDFRRAMEAIDLVEAKIEPLVPKGGIGKLDIVAGIVSSVFSIVSGNGDNRAAQRAVSVLRAWIEIRYFRALVFKSLERWSESERNLVEVLPQARSLGMGPGIEFYLAHAMIGQGRYAEGMEAARKLVPAFEQGAYRPKRAVLQRLIAEGMHAVGDSQNALVLVDKAIEDLRVRYFDPDQQWRAYDLRARICARLADSAGELAAYRDAVDSYVRLQRAPLGYRLDSTYLSLTRGLFSRAIAAALSRGDGASCCHFVEALKSRTLSTVLTISPGTATTELDRQFEEVNRRLQSAEYELHKGRGNRAHRDELLRDKADLLERIRVSDPRWRRLSAPVEFDLRATLARLVDRRQAALSLYYDRPRLTAVLLHEGEARAARIELTSEVTEKIDDYARNLQKRSPDPYKHDFSGSDYGVAAEDLIPAELLAKALNASSLIVVPHGVLHLLPWAALMHGGRRLFEQVPVAILPNLACITALSSLPPPQAVAILAVSHYSGLNVPDLPQGAPESEEIAALYRKKGGAVLGPLLDADASTSAFWNLARTPVSRRVFHVSCHGDIVSSEPMSSGLLLADSKLDAAQVARTKLPFEEAVLSACSTGWRPTQVGDLELLSDEILGVPASFLEGGASAVVLSIPKAGEGASRRFSVLYHRARVEGLSPINAFREAQQETLRSGVDVGTWAGFVLYAAA